MRFRHLGLPERIHAFEQFLRGVLHHLAMRLSDFDFEDVHLDLAHRLEERTLPHLGGAFHGTLLFRRTARFRLAGPGFAAGVVVVGLAMGITAFTHNFTFHSGRLAPASRPRRAWFRDGYTNRFA
jgi:hypothetical protein